MSKPGVPSWRTKEVSARGTEVSENLIKNWNIAKKCNICNNDDNFVY
jgi:hypothetical protein